MPIEQSINYIENHLTKPTSVEDAAKVAGYSRHHFSRTFLAVTGLTPISYLRKRRVSEAARELVTTSRRILDIALDYQFGSQEAFTRSFRREFGVNPGFYRRRKQLRHLWGRISLGVSNLLYPGQGISPSPKLIVPERALVAAIISPQGRQSRSATFAGGVDVTTREAVEIRPAHRQDIPTICALYQELHEFTVHGVPQRLESLGDYECFNASALSLRLSKLMDAVELTIWVAELHGQVVGLAEVYLRADEDSETTTTFRYGYLQSLVVHHPFRGRGIGAKLLSVAEDWSRKRGADELRLDTWELEQGPLYFYERQGYRTLRRTLVREL